jgi:uncharacterized membrane protein (UPF0127 family)
MSLVKIDGTAITADVELADTYFKRMAGLMFRKGLDGALIFDMGRLTYDGIHMLFVRFPIDVLFLDDDKRIVDVRAGVMPWVGTAFPRARFRYAIELPSGTIKRYGIKAGEELAW